MISQNATYTLSIVLAALAVMFLGQPVLADHGGQHGTIVVTEACDNPRSFLAGLGCTESGVAVQGIVKGKTISQIIGMVVRFIMSLAAMLALLALIWGGIIYIISLGDEDRARTAKRIILYAITGLFVIGLSFLILQTVSNLLNR